MYIDVTPCRLSVLVKGSIKGSPGLAELTVMADSSQCPRQLPLQTSAPGEAAYPTTRYHRTVQQGWCDRQRSWHGAYFELPLVYAIYAIAFCVLNEQRGPELACF